MFASVNTLLDSHLLNRCSYRWIFVIVIDLNPGQVVDLIVFVTLFQAKNARLD